MFFSIIIPTRNRPKELTRCLEHIKSQTFIDYEVLIIDDNSDSTTTTQYPDIIPADTRFKLIKQNPSTTQSKSVSNIRNVGINNAQGRYIAFCDDDDFWTDDEHLFIAHNTLNNSNIDMYIANQNAVNSDGIVEFNSWFPHLSKNINSYKEISKKNNTYLINLKQLLNESEIPQLNTLIIKINVCKKNHGFWQEIHYVEDRDFYLRALEYCNNICFRNIVVSQHNIPNINLIKSISNSISETDQHILMITVLHHVLANTERKEIIKFCKKFLGWKYRNLSLISKKQSQLMFAETALINSFTIKWFAFTLYLRMKYLLFK